MKLHELKQEIEKYQYFEDMNIIDVALASIIATRLKLGDPVWLVIIGPSSGGKSQILRPLALTDTKFLHRIDDLTENTFLSGMKLGGDKDASLLTRIGKQGMIVMSDLTVLFSKAKETRATILSQFRMIYDGEMVKFSGTSDKPITWKGYLGIIAGSTPSIYAHFEEVADMGERFIYYRMKEYNAEKATRLSMNRTIYGKELDEKLSALYEEYIRETVVGKEENVVLSEIVKERILSIAMFAERIRTTAHVDFRERIIDRIPTPAMPMRVALQLTSIAKGLHIMRNGELSENDLSIIDWCGYSLGNEEKRACLRVLGHNPYGAGMKTQTIADKIGLSTTVTNSLLQNLSAIGVVKREGTSDSLLWRILAESDWHTVRRVEKIDTVETNKEREISSEEKDEMSQIANKAFDEFVKAD